MSSSNKDFKSVYDREFVRPVKVMKEGKKSTIKPSLLGSPCIRKIYYNYMNTQEEIAFPLKNARVTTLGSLIGKHLAETFYKQGIGIKFHKEDGSFYTDYDGSPDFEFRVDSEELQIALGKIDMVARFDDGIWLGEFKSINERGFKELNGPKPDHLIQGVIYLYLFNKFLKEGKFAHIKELEGVTKVRGIKFVYYHKDSSTLKEYSVSVADQVFIQVVTKIQEVMWFAQNDQLPPPTLDWCKSCPYQQRCAKNLKATDPL